MEHSELRDIQEKIKFDAPAMASCLGVTVRAYRNYLYGANSIPPVVERAALELLAINEEFMRTAPARIDARIPKCGIMSEATEDWE